jgi:peptidoglycan/xylan/chitin deacetylase (PgdA/CDA1 family)
MTFKSTSISFIIAICIIVWLHIFSGISLAWLILPATVYLALAIYGTSVIHSDFYGQPYCYADTSEKEIALTFDDGPNQEYTPKVLSILAQYNAPATFFVIGKNVQGNENILKQIDAEGHAIGNHSYTHSYFLDFKSVRGFKDELSRTEYSVFKITGKRMKLFRPPYGVTTPHLVKAAKLLNYSLIGWNIRSFDTTADTAQIISDRVQKQIKPGAIVLFHDTSDKTVEVLKQTLDFTKKSGYRIARIEQLLKIDAYQ